MRPDDEYQELNTDLDGEPRGRAMSWLVLGVAVIGFGALAYYAYQSGTQSVVDGQMVVVKADEGPIKQVPADAGGEQFPNQEKTIYDALSPGNEAKVEQLLPAPEEPVIPEPAVGDAVNDGKAPATTTYVNQDATEQEDADDDMVPSEGVKEADVSKSSPAPVAKPVDAVAPLTETPVVPKAEPKKVTAAAVVPPKAAEPAPAPAEPKAEPIVPEKKAEPALTEKTEPVVEKKTEPAKASSGNYKIQLGAFKSEEEARASWDKIKAKHGDLIHGSPIVVQAQVNGSTFYRLRASGFSSADVAKKACASLSSRGQDCFYAGK